MGKYYMDPTSIVEDTERTRICSQTDRRTDGRTDGQGETSIPPFQLRWSGGIINNRNDLYPFLFPGRINLLGLILPRSSLLLSCETLHISNAISNDQMSQPEATFKAKQGISLHLEFNGSQLMVQIMTNNRSNRLWFPLLYVYREIISVDTNHNLGY